MVYASRLLVGVALPFLVLADPLAGYGTSVDTPECAYACQSAVPQTMDCPEYKGMTEIKRNATKPSPSCLANDTSFLTSVAWCIYKHCEGYKTWELSQWWDSDLINDKENKGYILKYSYEEALSHVDQHTPPKTISKDEKVLNRTIAVKEDRYIGYLNGYISSKRASLTGSRYS